VHRRRAFRFGIDGRGDGSILRSAVRIVCLSRHFRILRDSLLARLPTDECTPHGTCHDHAANDENRGSEHDPAAPCYVRDED